MWDLKVKHTKRCGSENQAIRRENQLEMLSAPDAERSRGHESQSAGAAHSRIDPDDKRFRVRVASPFHPPFPLLLLLFSELRSTVLCRLMPVGGLLALADQVGLRVTRGIKVASVVLGLLQELSSQRYLRTKVAAGRCRSGDVWLAKESRQRQASKARRQPRGSGIETS